MSQRTDITGQRFGHLTVAEIAGRDKGGRATWRCVCDCGNAVSVAGYSLRSGHTTSCGCLQKERTRADKTTHGGKGTRLYGIWAHMKNRCLSKTSRDYKDYGGRGITVCAEWANSFEAFRDWALANGYRDGLTIDRKDTDGNYCPENCRWATQKEQQNNRRNNHIISFNGETHTLAQWAELTGIKFSTLYMRLRRGWSAELALTTR